jgi:uncharacterized protein YhfF/RimJ/RimL family protein N-acetyltransferase
MRPDNAANMEPLPKVEDLAPTLRGYGIDLPAGVTRVGAFGDSPALSEELLALVRVGRKRGGASLLWAHEAESEPIPSAGDTEIVVNHLNAPSLVTRITEVEVVPFNQVSAQFAAREGEGDGSLDYWRKAHWAFFSRECERLGREPSDTMPVVCSSFEVLDVVPVSDPLPRFADNFALRRLAASDLASFQAYRQDPMVAQYQDWAPKSDAEASAFLAKMSAVTLLQPGKWSQIGIAEPDGVGLIGDIGVLLAHDGRQAEIGFALRRQSQGRGIATAAVREAINLVFERTNVDRMVGIVDVRNVQSIRLLQRVGMHMTESREVLFREEHCVEHIYVISRRHDV